jgi:hypothetical protein
MATDAIQNVQTQAKPIKIESLNDALRLFMRFPSPRVILATMVVAWAVRVAVGSISWWDLAIGLGIIAFWPIQEWLIHVFILHFRPRKILGRTVDLHVAEKHRLHHTIPWVLRDVFVPFRTLLQVVLIGLPVFIVLWSLVLPLSIGLTGVAVFATFGLVYEWVHYLVHTGWKPRSSWYRKLWQHHRWHHFKNENYWYGVSRLEGDMLMRTAPDVSEVETSPTARNLDGRADCAEA